MTNIFADILHSNETRPSLTVWTMRLAAIASVLMSSSTSVSRPAGAGSQEVKSPSEMSEGLGSQRTTTALAGNVSNLNLAPLDPSESLRAAAPFYFRGPGSERLQAIDCLAAAGWYEAGDDPDGERSVMQVVLNRVRHPAFPSTVCGVVFEGSQLPTGCQFTFTCDGSLVRRHASDWEMRQAHQLAAEALDGRVDTSVGQATHYHADYVSPWWNTQMVRLATVGPQIFYRWPEQRGYLSARANVGPEANYQALTARAEAIYVDRIGAISHAKLNGADLVAQAPQTPVPLGQTKLQSAPSIATTTSTLFLKVDASAAVGAWALTALRECAGRRDCQVLAYDSSETVERNRTEPAAARDRPLFLFVRDGGSGMDLALWDCRRENRPDASQCLPSDRKALDELMRERGE